MKKKADMTAAEFKQKFGNVTVRKASKSGRGAGIDLTEKRQPNKLEQEWMSLCREYYHCGSRIMFEPFTLLLSDGTKYTGDIVISEQWNAPFENVSRIWVYEVKPHFDKNDRWKRGFKAARHEFPWIKFILARKQKDGTWITT